MPFSQRFDEQFLRWFQGQTENTWSKYTSKTFADYVATKEYAFKAKRVERPTLDHLWYTVLMPM
jgi:hypothetical protein